MPTTKKRLVASLTVISITLGFMMAIQYKSTQQINEQAAWYSSNKDVQQATEKLAELQKGNKELEDRLNQLNKQIVGLQEQAARNDSSDMKQQLTSSRILAGLSPVKGAGITMTIDDSKKDTKSPNPVTHDTDVMQIVNELFLSGAEAVAVNGERISSVTGILCVGPSVRINDRLMTPPYKIDAIGDPGTLITGLTMRGGIIDVLKSQKRSLQVQGPKEVQMLRLKGYSGDSSKLTSSSTGN